MKRLRLASTLGVLVVLATIVVAWAYYTTAGEGTASGTVGSFTAPTISVPAASTGSHAVTWTQQASISSGENSEVTYTVERKLDSGSFQEITSGGCDGPLPHGTASCTDTVGASGSYTYRVVAKFRSWTATSNEAGAVVVTLSAGPASPTSVALANGGGVGNAHINAANRTNLSVDVGLGATSTAADTVHVTITDGTNTTIDATAPATTGAGTVMVTGIDATTLNDGSVTIRATSSNLAGTSGQTTTSVTKDTVKPSSSAGTVSNITSGNTFTVPYTTGEAGANLQKVDLYVETPDADSDYTLEETDSSPSQNGESFSYDGATTDGTYRFYTRAEDNAGNVEDTPGVPDATATRTTAGFRMATGSYTGTGVDNRTIAGLGFQPDVVIVKGAGTQIPQMRTSTMTGDVSKPLAGGTALASNSNTIQSLTADGFVLGSGAAVNTNNVAYSWIAFKAAAGFLKVGSYTGTGATLPITGAGFQPEYAAVLPADGSNAANRTPQQRYVGMANTFAFEGGSGAGSMINSLDSDGFTLGNSAVVNANGIGYHYVLFNEVPGAIEASDYDGANNTGQTITGVGFQPDYVMMRGDANDSGHHRPASLGGAASLFYTGTANTTDGITSLTSDGFTVGGIDQVNKNGVNHYYLALKNTDGGSSLFSTQSVTANQDSWVQQASPTDTKGSDSKLVVSSESSNKNVRGLVQFSPLPSTPGGFTMKHSQMYLNNEQSGATAANRTIEAYRAATTWAEATVNWNTKPASAGTAATALTLSTAGFIGWNVTSLVSDMYSGSNFGFILRDQVEDSATKREQLFTSSEGTASNHPRLDVTFGN